MYLPILTTFPRLRIINFAVTPADLFRPISYAKQNVWIWATTAIEVFFFSKYTDWNENKSVREIRGLYTRSYFQRKSFGYENESDRNKCLSNNSPRSYKYILEVIGYDRVFHDITNTPDSKRINRNRIIQESDTKKNGNIKYNLDFKARKWRLCYVNYLVRKK